MRSSTEIRLGLLDGVVEHYQVSGNRQLLTELVIGKSRIPTNHFTRFQPLDDSLCLPDYYKISRINHINHWSTLYCLSILVSVLLHTCFYIDFKFLVVIDRSIDRNYTHCLSLSHTQLHSRLIFSISFTLDDDILPLEHVVIVLPVRIVALACCGSLEF